MLSKQAKKLPWEAGIAEVSGGRVVGRVEGGCVWGGGEEGRVDAASGRDETYISIVLQKLIDS